MFNSLHITNFITNFHLNNCEVFVLKTSTGKCLKPEQFLKAEHLLKHAFPYRDRSFYGPYR